MRNGLKWTGNVAALAWLCVCFACTNNRKDSIQDVERFPEVEVVKDSVGEECRHEEQEEPKNVARESINGTTSSGHSPYTYDDKKDKTDNEAYIDGWVTAEEEFYTGSDAGTNLPVEGDDDYETDYDKGYGY